MPTILITPGDRALLTAAEMLELASLGFALETSTDEQIISRRETYANAPMLKALPTPERERPPRPDRREQRLRNKDVNRLVRRW